MSARLMAELESLEFTRPDKTTLNDRVYFELRRMIMSGRMRPGQEISIRTLAAIVGVSSMPVRTALQRLVTEGAIEVRRNKTFALTTFDVGSFREICMLRQILEGKAAELAAARLEGPDIKALDKINDRMFRSRTRNSAPYLDLNREFHFRIYEAAAMPRLLKLIESLWLQIGPILNVVASKEELPVGEETHEAMVRALERRDSAGAKKTIEREIAEAARVIEQRMAAISTQG